jgi:hypothetical protein
VASVAVAGATAHGSSVAPFIIADPERAKPVLVVDVAELIREPIAD